LIAVPTSPGIAPEQARDREQWRYTEQSRFPRGARRRSRAMPLIFDFINYLTESAVLLPAKS
jgi:hypothetical protein